MKIPFGILESMGACDEAISWLLRQPNNWQQAWENCPNLFWRLWLIDTITRGSPPNSMIVRRVSAAKAEVLISISQQFSDKHTHKVIGDVIELLLKHASGRVVTSAARSAARSAAWSAINDIYLVYFPTAPTVNEMWTTRGM